MDTMADQHFTSCSDPDMKEASVLIYGSGAVGSILGWRIAQHTQARVSVVCRSNYDTVRKTGFSFQTIVWGAGHFMPEQVLRAGTLAKRQPQSFDYVVCANKVTRESCPSILRDLHSLVGRRTTLVCAQNGMDVELPLRHAFPHNTILSAICNIGCSQPVPGQIRQTAGLNPKAFQIGVYGQSTQGQLSDRARCDSLLAVDSRFGGIDDVSRHRWRKLMFNAVFNAACALSNSDTHKVLRRPDTLQLARRLASEAVHIANLSDAELDEDYDEKVISLASQSGCITPSTLQDVRARRPLEIVSIWGFLLERAECLGVDAPALKLVHDALQQLNFEFKNEHDLGARVALERSFLQPGGAFKPAMDQSLQQAAMVNEEHSRLHMTGTSITA